MKPIIDPRDGDIEDDASSTKRRSLFSLAGSLLVEISLPKLAIAWTLLIGLPGVMLGVAPLVVSLWIYAVSSKAYVILTGITPILLLAVFVGLGWFGGRPLLRLIENSFWSLNALGVQPGYIVCREGLKACGRTFAPPWRERDPAGLGPCGQRRGVGLGDQRGRVLARRARLAGFALAR